MAFIFSAIAAMFCLRSADSDFSSAKEIIVMRDIGHQILLSSGDRSSRVLPVHQISRNQYQISFEQSLQFVPDSVVGIIRQAIANHKLPQDYLVNVVDCQKNQVVFGFAILRSEQTNLVPCRGRRQPKGCYTVNITFKGSVLSSQHSSYLLGAGSGLTALILVISGIRKSYRKKSTGPRQGETSTTATEILCIGDYKFYRDQHYLAYEDQHISLSGKEVQLLTILSRKRNELVGRDELQRVWEDEGVIVGRSLDVFISKLRKKLAKDPTVHLVNVHGKGYKLEIENCLSM